eukprot:TRINITY_DN290_c3_g1_i10.p1 TRINITY_DN290_c3_g1~~TRINITY_DN290_c3_g1_i10.p1  ORF type:complete len:534 (+),score=158.76 TRINITY_DN290_c3_g1_i10:38-1639(+)
MSRTAVLLACALGAAAAPPKPHVVFILADDYGWNDIGYNQNQKSSANPDGHATTNGVIATPHLDTLSAEGVRLENYYVEYLCSPTRGTVMTGRYPSHTGIGPDIIKPESPYGMPAKEVMWPELMKASGYKTHAVGKWHLGICNEKYTPTMRGFDTFFGYLLGAEDYWTHERGYDKPPHKRHFDLRNGTEPGVMSPLAARHNGTYSSVLFADEAARLIHAHDPATPFFMYLPFQSVHTPSQAPVEYIDHYNSIVPHATKKGYTRQVKAAMVTAMDDGVGVVVQALKDNAMFDDTIIIFSTDNGAPVAEGQGNNFPLRGWKSTPWEGGVRGVGWVRGTNSGLAPLPKGVVSHELMHSSDWLPTVVRGVAKGSTAETQPLDGHNQWGVLAGKGENSRRSVVHVMPAAGVPISNATKVAVRQGDHKLLIPGSAYSKITTVYQATPPEMAAPPTQTPTPAPHTHKGIDLYVFDVVKDPTESTNLAATRPDLVKTLLAAAEGHHASAVPDLALSHPFDPKSNPAHLPDQAWGPWGCPFQ